MKMKFKSALFGYDKKQVYDYIKSRDVGAAEILEKSEAELKRLRESEELVNAQIRNTFIMPDNPIFMQKEKELKDMEEKIEKLKKQALVLIEFMEMNELEIRQAI